MKTKLAKRKVLFGMKEIVATMSVCLENRTGVEKQKNRFEDSKQFFAEEGGFEPPVPLRVRQFSKLLVSATHPSFLLRL